MSLFAIVSFSDPGFLPVQPLPAATRAGVLIPETEAAVEEEGDGDDQGSCGGWSSSSATTDDDDGDGEGEEKEEDEATVAADAEVRRLTSPSRAHQGGHRMRAFTGVDPLLGRADVEAAECGVCGLDRLPIRWVILVVLLLVDIYVYGHVDG